MAELSPEHNNSAACYSDSIKNGELFMKKLEAKNKAIDTLIMLFYYILKS